VVIKILFVSDGLSIRTQHSSEACALYTFKLEVDTRQNCLCSPLNYLSVSNDFFKSRY